MSRAGAIVAGLVAAIALSGAVAQASDAPRLVRHDRSVVPGQQTGVTFDAGLATACAVRFSGPGGRTAGPFGQKLRGGVLRMTWRVPARAAAGRWVARITCRERRLEPASTRATVKVLGRARTSPIASKRSVRFSVGRRPGGPAVPQTLSEQRNDQGPEGDQLGGGPYDNARIADIALSRLGTSGGQCKQAVNDWVFAASGGVQRLGGNYFQNYADQGGTQIPRDQAMKGDIIQLHNPADPRGYYWPMHTAVIVGHQPGSNAFDVVDSNYVARNKVGRHMYNPYAEAGSKLRVTIWRMGTVPAAPAPAPAPVITPAPTSPTPTPSPAPTQPAPPKPTASNLRVVVYGGGHVGVAFDVGWQAGRDPVTCHFFRDGVEVFTAQCGTSSSKQFYGVPPGTHSFYATVSDRFGVYSDPSNTVVVNTS